MFGSLYQLLAFNGDPHPGNYLFHPGGRVTFLDFGLVKHFEQRDADVGSAPMMRASLAGDDCRLPRGPHRASGCCPSTTDVQRRRTSTDYFGHFYDFVRGRRARDDHARVRRRSRCAASSTPRGPFGEIMRAANVPPAFVIIQRINLGLYAVLGELTPPPTGAASPRSCGRGRGAAPSHAAGRGPTPSGRPPELTWTRGQVRGPAGRVGAAGRSLRDLDLDRFFRPRTVLVLGASDSRAGRPPA